MRIVTRTDFIQLNRTFHDLKAETEGTDDAELRRAYGVKATGWPELEAEYRVVLLAEAGAGKTEEIRHAAISLRDRASPAFFMRIEHLAHDFEDAFEVGSAPEFEEWIASTAEGWLFLDSVDEARLRGPKDFDVAMRKVARRLSPAMQRARILVAGRATAWRPASDMRLCEGMFPFRPSSPTAEAKAATSDAAENAGSSSGSVARAPHVPDAPVFRVVALDDLSHRQIRIFLQARGVADAEAFLDAVERADAGVFTARPQDLEELAGFWTDNGRIGSRLEIMRASIDRRLAERDEDRSLAQPLSSERARAGARLLAAAATLTRQPLVRVPDGDKAAEGLPVEEVLTGWTPAECAALLSRPIFDEAIYGAVRFHHRSVREFMAAEWLASLLERRGSRRRVEQLFFKEQYGLQVIVPALRPLLPWLVLLDQRILDRTLALAPAVVFEGGDPRQLPAETRRRVLRDVCDELSGPAHGRSFADYAAVQRFAGPDLAEEIRAQLRAHGENDDVVYFLMRMIWHGEIGALAEEAKQVALTSREKYARTSAFKALATTGAPEDMAEVRNALLSEPDEIRRSWLTELVETLPHDRSAVDWLLAALARTKPPKPHGVDHLADPLAAYLNASTVDHLAVMVSGLAELLAEPPTIDRRTCHISKRHRWLAESAAAAIAILAEARHPIALDPTVLATLRRLPLAEAQHGLEVGVAGRRVAEAVRSWPELNYLLFWRAIQEARAERKPEEGPLVDWWPTAIFGAYWAFGADDFDWVAADVTGRPLADDRLVALTLAFHIYREAGRPRAWRERLKRATSGEERLSAKLATLLRPPAAGRSKWRDEHRRWAKRAKDRRLRDETGEAAWRERLRADHGHLRATADGSFTWDHHTLLHRMRPRRTGSERWSDADWSSLAKEHGEDVARAFRDGAVASWRAFTPPLVSEGAAANTTPFASVLGLAGLAIEARETDGWAEGLSTEEAELATRFALEELNGFPPWLPALYAAHPEAVLSIVLREITYELESDTGERESWYLLYDASWAGQWMWDRLAPALMAMFEPEPRSDGNLRYMLTIVQGAATSDAALAALASAKALALEDNERAAIWAAIWTGVDPSGAIPVFARRLDGIADANARAKAAMVYFTTLLGTRRHGSCARSGFQTIEHLTALYLLAERHVRREDDIHRAGTGVYSPGLRDDAQDARSAIFSFLTEISGKEAYLALVELSNLHPDQRSRPWMTMHARDKAAADADTGPWTVRQVRQFADALERTPTNHRELWELAVDRLLDLAHDLEDGDGSVATLLLRARDEEEIRNFIGNWCRDRAVGRYSVPQEEEFADEKRSDLRFVGAGLDAPVPVELKIADNWTGPQLVERLENQLCGDYLRDQRSGRGIYLLVNRGTKAGWEMRDGRRADGFAALIEALSAHWSAASNRFPNVEGISVVGIDLTARTGKAAVE